MTTLINNVGQLIGTRAEARVLSGKELHEMPAVENAFLLAEEGVTAGYGNIWEQEIKVLRLPKEIIDVVGGFVLPCWCDSHYHTMYTG